MNPATFLLKNAIFTTRQFAVSCRIGIDAASRKLTRLMDHDGVARVTRGLWYQPEHPRFTAYAAVPFLLGNEQGYVSFLSAMHRHGLLSQIPGSIQVATSGHARVLRSRIGRFEFIRIRPHMMMAGVAMSASDPAYGIATAEKALLDTLYISTRKGRRFARLPELDLTNIDRKEFFALFDQQVSAPQVRRAINARLGALGSNSKATALVRANVDLPHARA